MVATFPSTYWYSLLAEMKMVHANHWEKVYSQLEVLFFPFFYHAWARGGDWGGGIWQVPRLPIYFTGCNEPKWVALQQLVNSLTAKHGYHSKPAAAESELHLVLITCHYSNCLKLIIHNTISESLKCSLYARMSCATFAWMYVTGCVCWTRHE